MKEISSTSNPLIKKILLLQEKSKLRKEENIFVIDGWKETQMAIANGFEVETILCQQSIVNSQWFDEIKLTVDGRRSTSYKSQTKYLIKYPIVEIRQKWWQLQSKKHIN